MSQAIFTDGLGYEGKVTLTLKNNNLVLKSKTYKNSGTAQLFKFLGYCLINAQTEAEKLLPKKIMLLYNDSGTPDPAKSTSVRQRSTYKPYVQLPTITSLDDTAQVKVVYNFEVPHNAIEDDFNQIALYGEGVNNIKEFSAYYFLTDNTGKFDLQDVSEWSPTTVLLVEWELTISNKNTEVIGS